MTFEPKHEESNLAMQTREGGPPEQPVDRARSLEEWDVFYSQAHSAGIKGPGERGRG